ncbi:hypothetical protein [Adhaeribacter soli]|uniref:Glycosyltransferase RgtA/B/C/D-like domain-containing protein n=1 Tax=Adhaeribacter soli TaxID=2607655 RepID=A0A5N1IS93_9BACT|nr:hypothetical protein [Adhaeribacter soli]KAA9327379.1 hypothetical protein F0P94_15810 [Adhaeribacter soli]
MNAYDFFLGPLYLAILYGIAYAVRSKVTTPQTKKYFILALTLKFAGAITLGLIYHFYYFGGDTQRYYKLSKVIYEALTTDFMVGIKLLLANGEFDPETFEYASRIKWYHSPAEYMVIKFTTVFSFLGFGSYTVAALFFAFFSFSGVWAAYRTFLKLYPKLTKEFAIAVLFLPSVVFWGSGLMKDSLTLGALGWLFYGFYTFAIEKRRLFYSAVCILLSGYLIYIVKVYILLSFLPPALLWVFNENSKLIKTKAIRILAKPVFLAVGGLGAYIAATTLTAGDKRYDVDKLAETTKINNEFLTEMVESGSGYNISGLDGTMAGTLQAAPQAINVALFRPYMWEVRNPFMLLSALEAFLFLFVTLRIFFRVGVLKTLKMMAGEPIVLFCMIFSLVMALAVGLNSGNFGTLVRYKIPFMPFYLSALYIMEAKVKEAALARKRRLKLAAVR